MNGRLDNNKTHCNWVVLKPWNTLSGPQAPITVGGGSGECTENEVLEVTKTSKPEIILPGVETDIYYSINMTNLYGQPRFIEKIIDYLPPGFHYIGPTSTTGNFTDSYPMADNVTLNGIVRQQLQWTEVEFGGSDVKIEPNESLLLNFWAKATKDVSGSYYNEVIVILKTSGLPPGFGDIGVLPGEYASNYSWTTGAVIVPAYDSSTDAEGVIIDANLALGVDSISITSFQVR